MQRTLPQIPTYMLLRYITGYENMADYKSAITQYVNSYENTARGLENK